MGRLTRYRALVGLGARRIRSRLRATERTQVALSVAGIAVVVALLLLVTSVGLSLAAGSTLGDETVDYWIVPGGEGASSAVTAVEGARLGQVHPAAERLAAREDVVHATPVLVELVRLGSPAENDTYVLAIGVVPGDGEQSLVGLPTAALSPGDPHYASGTYDGPWTGEAVVSESAASALGADRGTELRVAGRQSNRTFTVADVGESRGVGLGQLPVVVVHLGELQELTGAAEGDTANQILVDGRAGADLEPVLQRVYPRTTVLTRGELLSERARSSQLPLAIAFSALLVTVAIGTLFLATTLGFTVAADAHQRALLSALGFSRASLTLLSVVQALAVVLLGGAAGVLSWLVLALAGNAVGGVVGDVTVFTVHPLLPLYGLGVALLVGLLVVPYLLVVARRNTGVTRLT